MQPRADRLDVYYGSDLVGALHDSAPLAFEFASTWRDGAQRKASTLFSLLLEVAGDTAGAFMLVAPGQTPEPPRYEATTWEAIGALLARRSACAIDVRGQGARILLAGAQDKTSHAKNLSICSVPGQGVTLTPFYDLMCTRLHPGLSPEFAFAIGGEARPGEMGPEHLAMMARQLGMQPRFLAQQARDVADRMPTAIEQAAREIAPALRPAASILAERLVRFMSSTTKKLAARLTA